MTAAPHAPEQDSPPEDLTGRLEGVSWLRVSAVLAIVVLFTEISPLQYTMFAASLQKIAPSFPGIGANINWTVIVFGLIAAAVSPLVGRLSDAYGKKRLFLICATFFLVGCLVDALTSTWALFLLGRCLQSIAGATALLSYGLIRDLMPRKFVPVGLGIAATGLGLSALVAPILGGWLVDTYSWRAIFWFLFAFTAVMIPLLTFFVPESKLRARHGVDYLGAVLLAGGVALVLIYVDKGQDWGWGRISALAWLIVGMVLLVAFVLIETRLKSPLVDVRLLLLNPSVALVLLPSLLASFLVGIQPYAAAYMTQTPGSDAIRAQVSQEAAGKLSSPGHPTPASAIGVHLDPNYAYGNGFSLMGYAIHISLLASLVAMAFGTIAGLLARRIGARLPLLVGLVALIVSAALYAALPYSWLTFMLVGGLFGAGSGMVLASCVILITEAVPADRQGVSTGMLGVTQGMGSAIGIAIITAFLNANPIHAKVSLNGHLLATAVLPGVYAGHGYTLGFIVGGAVSIVALILVLLLRSGRTPATGGAIATAVSADDSSLRLP